MARGAQCQGFVLVIVLWVLAALTLITIGFSHRAFLNQRASSYSLDHSRAMMMARGAAHRGMVELQNKWVKDLMTQSAEMTHLGQEWAQPADLLREAGYFSLPVEEAKFDVVEFRISDAESRININTAPEALLERIEALGRRTARKIIQRRTEETEDGEAPIPFQSLEELRYLDGVDDEAWFGEDDEPGLKDLFTTHGDGKINLNTASRDVLLSLPDMDEASVESLLAYRAGPDGEIGTPDDRGFKDMNEVSEKTGVGGSAADTLQQFGKFTSGVFMIRGVATLRAGKVRASVTAVAVANPQHVRVLGWQEEPLGA